MRATDPIRSVAVLLLLSSSLFALPRNHYQVKLELRPEVHFLRASATLDIASPADGTSLRMLLNRSLRVTRVECKPCKGFRFATSEQPPYRYIAEGVPLYIDFKHPVKIGDPLKIRIDYEGELSRLEWPVNVIGPDWTELALYSGWFPFHPDLRFRYDLEVKADPAYVVTGAGVVTAKTQGLWTIHQPDETMDIVVVAAHGLKTLRASGRTPVTVQYAPAVAESVAQQALKVVDTSLQRYFTWFGPSRGDRLTVVLTERTKGGGYARPGLVMIPLLTEAAIGKPGFVWNISHEVGHLWWTGAPVTTWEDWLNESFAEYSAWLITREVLGEKAFEQRIADARRETAARPAIWGIDRNAADAHMVLYDKGALLLHDLSEQIGEQKFLALLSAFARSNRRTTTDFLSLLQAATSADTRNRFEQSLRE